MCKAYLIYNKRNAFIISYPQGYDIICRYARSSPEVNVCARHFDL